MSQKRPPNNAASPARSDALLDAYRQANALDDAHPSPQVRHAVLAHARVVAQSAAPQRADTERALPEALVARPAANDRAWFWRAVAGLVLGVAGFWLYRAAVPAANDLPVASAPGAAPAVEPPVAATPGLAPAASPADTAVAVTGTGSQGANASTVTATVTATRHHAPQTAEVMTNASEARQASASREAALAGAKPEEPVAALARPSAAATAAAVVMPAPTATAAAIPASPAASASATASATPAEDVVAMAETAKRKTVAGRAAPESAADAVGAVVGAVGAPARTERNENRAKLAAELTAEHTAVATPAAAAPAVPAVPAAAPPPPRIGDMTPGMQRGMANVALLAALRAGSVDDVRGALLRGADVNVRDDRGRSALQIAREANQHEIVRVLQAAGAK